MEKETLYSAWTEIQIDADSITLSLLTEGSDGATVEETARYTFDELQEMAGAIEGLHLSDETGDILKELNIDSENDESPSLSVDDPAIDSNTPEWSNDDRLIIRKVTEIRADEYVIDGPHSDGYVPSDEQTFNDMTVARANPSFPSDDRVILADYVDGDDTTYAFPESRVEKAGLQALFD